MKTTLPARLHAMTWSVACLLLIIPLFNGKPVEQFTGNVIATLFWMAVYYLFNRYVTPQLLLREKIEVFFVVSLLILMLLPFAGYTLLFLSRALFRGDFTNFYQGYSLPMHLSGFKAMVFAGLWGSFTRLLADRFSTGK
jgi:hypothetical protein